MRTRPSTSLHPMRALQWPAMNAEADAGRFDTREDDQTIRPTQAEALASVLAVLHLCGAGKLRCSEKTQRPAAATVAAVAEVLAGGDFYATEPIAAFAWPLLIQAGGLAELAGSRLQLTAKGRAALGQPPAETIRALWRSWVGKAVTDELAYLSRYDGLRAVRLNALGAYALGLTDRYQPPAASDTAVAGSLKVLPNLDIVVTGELPPADRLMLDTYAQRTADRVWALREATLLAALDAGRGLDELRAFLAARATHELPNPVTTLLADVTDRAGRLRNLGVVRLVECADPALAALIANDRRLRGLCQPIGDRHVAVAIGREAQFRRALRALGHLLPSDPL